MQQGWQRFKDICSGKKRKKMEGEGAVRKTSLLKFLSTTNSRKLNTYHKQTKKAELIRAEAIKQISKKVDFSTPQSWGRIRIFMYANLGTFYTTGDGEKITCCMKDMR